MKYPSINNFEILLVREADRKAELQRNYLNTFGGSAVFRCKSNLSSFVFSYPMFFSSCYSDKYVTHFTLSIKNNTVQKYSFIISPKV